MSKTTLFDKIKGGWAGQVIGCTYGGPTEFEWRGQIIPDDHAIVWDDTRAAYCFDKFPGLYDDVYMDGDYDDDRYDSDDDYAAGVDDAIDDDDEDW